MYTYDVWTRGLHKSLRGTVTPADSDVLTTAHYSTGHWCALGSEAAEVPVAGSSD